MVITTDNIKKLAASQPRPPIRPKVNVVVRTCADREAVIATAKKVIAEHRDVLMALKDR